MKEKTNRREWVKNAAIIFLAVMLVLTLFSNTIMNYSLPEVSTQRIKSGTIEFEVKGTAIVEANDPLAVVTEEDRVVAEVLAQSGQAVNEGDVLIRLEPKESTELLAAKEQLQSMEEAYQRRIISGELWTEAEMVESGNVPTYEEYKTQLNTLLEKIASAEWAVEQREDGTPEKASGEEWLATLREEYAALKEQALTVMDLRDEYELIEEQRAKVAELEAVQLSTEITAPVGGTVAAVYCRTGQTIAAGSTVALIQITDKGCTMSMTVSAEEAESLQIGEEAEFTGSWYSRNLAAVISGFYPDPDNMENMIVEFSVDGQVVDGQAVEVTVGARSTEYDYTVPNSALRKDSNGSFILVLTAKQSPLGTRYYATRVDVSVLESDETTSAVLMLEETEGYVITTSSAPVEAGDMVRLAGK